MFIANRGAKFPIISKLNKKERVYLARPTTPSKPAPDSFVLPDALINRSPAAAIRRRGQAVIIYWASLKNADPAVMVTLAEPAPSVPGTSTQTAGFKLVAFCSFKVGLAGQVRWITPPETV